MSEVVVVKSWSRAEWLPHTRAGLVTCLLALPWLNPFAPGPSASAFPWLFSSFCGILGWWLIHESPVKDGQSTDWARVVAGSWIAAALASSVIALCQYFGVAAHFSPLMNATEVGEAYGNLRQRNQFGSLTDIGIAAVLWSPLRLKRSHAIGAVMLLAVGNAASVSRTGLLQLLMLTAFAAAWTGPERRTRLGLCLAAGAAYAAAALLLPLALEAYSGLEPDRIWTRLTRGYGCSSRSVLWSNVIYLIGQKPWLGWGWGELDYAHYVTPYPGPRFCDILDNAHNLLLHLAVELGIPLAALICGTFTCWVLRARPWRETDGTRQMAWAVLAVILLHSMLEYPLWYGPFQIAFGLSLWMLLRSGEPRASGNGHLILRTIFMSALVAMVYAAWDYHRASQIYLPYEARDAAYRDDTIARIRGSRLFRDQVQFAELTTTPLTAANAQWTFDTATALLHFSPEPRVIEKLIESSLMLGRMADAEAHLRRFSAAFPGEHASWASEHGWPERAPTSSPVTR